MITVKEHNCFYKEKLISDLIFCGTPSFVQSNNKH